MNKGYLSAFVVSVLLFHFLAELPEATDTEILPITSATSISEQNYIAWESSGGQGPIRFENFDYDEGLSDSSPSIAILLTHFGISGNTSKIAVELLPQEVGLSLSPYSFKVDENIKLVEKSGRSIFVDLPLEPQGYPFHDLGPLTLLSSVSPAENREKLGELLSKFGVIDTLVGIGGDNFFSDGPSVNSLLRELVGKRMNLIAPRLDDLDISGLNVPKGMSILEAKFNIEGRLGQKEIRRKLADAEKIALDEEGLVVVIARTHPMIVEEILVWIETLSLKGIVLANLGGRNNILNSNSDLFDQ